MRESEKERERESSERERAREREREREGGREGETPFKFLARLSFKVVYTLPISEAPKG